MQQVLGRGMGGLEGDVSGNGEKDIQSILECDARSDESFSILRCSSGIQNPQYACVIEVKSHLPFPKCCPKPTQCRDDI